MRKIFLAALLFSATTGFCQEGDSTKNSIAIVHEQNHFDKQFSDPWYGASLQYKRRFSFGPAIARVNYANRFNRNGLQFEGEAYPKIGQKLYAYVGAGFSNDFPVFSKWRTGASLYHGLPKAWEAEAGYRQLYFDKSIWIGVAGLSKYAGSWLLNLRSFFSFNAPTDNVSVFFNARKYFRNEVDYFWFQLGRGISPDEARNIQLNTSGKLTSEKIAGGVKFSLSRSVQMQLSAGWSRDEYATDVKGNQYTGAAGFEFKF